MSVESLLEKLYPPSTLRGKILWEHSRSVCLKAIEIAEKLQLNDEYIDFIKNGALLHDVGICETYAPEIGCTGNYHYITHGVRGKLITESEGLEKYSMVCQRHVGTGLRVEDILKNRLPLPLRDMTPLTLGEEIISYSDLFFSKTPSKLSNEKSYEDVFNEISTHGAKAIKIFKHWHMKFSI